MFILVELSHDGNVMFELEVVISERDGSDARVVGGIVYTRG